MLLMPLPVGRATAWRSSDPGGNRYLAPGEITSISGCFQSEKRYLCPSAEIRRATGGQSRSERRQVIQPDFPTTAVALRIFVREGEV